MQCRHTLTAPVCLPTDILTLQDAAAEVDAKRAELAEAQAALAAGGQGNDALLARIQQLQSQLEAATASPQSCWVLAAAIGAGATSIGLLPCHIFCHGRATSVSACFIPALCLVGCAAQAEVAAKGEQLHNMSLELRQAQEEAADKAKAAEEAVAALKAGQVRLVLGLRCSCWLRLAHRLGCLMDRLVCCAAPWVGLFCTLLCLVVAMQAQGAHGCLVAWLPLQAVMDRNRTSVQDELADLKEGLRLVREGVAVRLAGWPCSCTSCAYQLSSNRPATAALAERLACPCLALQADARAEGLEAEIESRDAELAVAAGKLAQMAGLMQQVDALNKQASRRPAGWVPEACGRVQLFSPPEYVFRLWMACELPPATEQAIPALPSHLQVADGEHALNLAGVEASSSAAELLTVRQVGSAAEGVV